MSVAVGPSRGDLTTGVTINAVFEAPLPPAGAVLVVQPQPVRMSYEDLGRAVAMASDAVDEGRDPDGFAGELIWAQHRIALLEIVVGLAARYLASGQDIELHTALGKAIEQARAAEASEHAGPRRCVS